MSAALLMHRASFLGGRAALSHRSFYETSSQLSGHPLYLLRERNMRDKHPATSSRLYVNSSRKSTFPSSHRSLSSKTTRSLPLSQSQKQKNTLQSLGIANDKIRTAKASIGSGDKISKKTKRGPQRIRSKDPRQLRPQNSASIRVKSVHAAQTIDVVKVLSKVFGVSSPEPPIRHMFGKTGVFVHLQNHKSSQNVAGEAEEAIYLSRFVAVFRFGSVVFFNLSPREAGKLLGEIKKYGTNAVSSGFERKENFEVVVQPDLDSVAYVANGDFCVVQTLDMHSVAVISSIMGQTVALDSYSDTVDELLANFSSINRTVTDGNGVAEMGKETLYKAVAQNNSIFIDMISKLGIKDRSDTAWNLSHYEKVYEGMKEEFEIDSRFENIEFKLNLIQQNAKFFLEMLNNQKSDSLEWVIIVLISFECVLMCLEMSGMGTVIFKTLVC